MEKSAFFAQARTDLKGPLEGLVVVEATTTWAGPMAGCVLADFGADVIKVEHPDGEVLRRVPPTYADSSLALFHETVNRNKRNVSLNLRHPEGRRLFLELCKQADCVIENFKPGTLASWGVGYADVAAVKPDIVYVSISGFGQFGPLSDRPGYDPIAQNFSGWSSLNGTPGDGPTKAPTFLGDDLGGVHGAMGAMAALMHRMRTGEGQHVDIALTDALIFQSDGLLAAGALGMPLKRWANQFSIAAPVNRYTCTDGDIYGGVLLDSHWKTLAALIGKPELGGIRGPERIRRRDEFDGLVADWCATHTTAEVVAAWNAGGLAVTRVNSFAEASREPHLIERDMLQDVTLSDGKTVPVVGPAAKFSRTPVRIRHAAPSLGQHNAEILGALGVDADALAKLREEGAV